MKKRIKTPDSVVHLNDPYFNDKKIVHLKTTPAKNGKTHIYWNKKREELIIGSKVHFPVPSIAHLERYRKPYFDLNRKEIQLGDSVVYFFGRVIQPMLCATVIGIKKDFGKIWLRLHPNHVQSKVFETWAEYKPDNFFLASNNLKDRAYAIPNQVYAVYQDELDKIEEIYAPIRSYRLIEEYLTNQRLNTGEKAFCDCHRALFRGIYSWAGVYRTHELVIGPRQHPTMHPSKVATSMKSFCQAFSTKYLPKVGNDRVLMLNALVFAHKELAWIHPFEDGNGRTMRLYLEIVAKTRGYGFDLTASMNSVRKKKYYHFAVWKAVQGYPKRLAALLDRALI